MKESACGSRALYHTQDWNENEVFLKIAPGERGKLVVAGLRVTGWRYILWLSVYSGAQGLLLLLCRAECFWDMAQVSWWIGDGSLCRINFAIGLHRARVRGSRCVCTYVPKNASVLLWTYFRSPPSTHWSSCCCVYIYILAALHSFYLIKPKLSFHRILNSFFFSHNQFIHALLYFTTSPITTYQL